MVIDKGLEKRMLEDLDRLGEKIKKKGGVKALEAYKIARKLLE